MTSNTSGNKNAKCKYTKLSIFRNGNKTLEKFVLVVIFKVNTKALNMYMLFKII